MLNMMHFSVCSFIFVLFCLCCFALDKDPYQVLGIRKGSSAPDVKKAYKALARQWHPDKNDSPEAESRFVEINEAYELLSDPKKKEHYDAYGTFEPDPWDGHHGRQDSFFHRTVFEDFGFKMPEPSAVYEKYRISLRQFEHVITPDSARRPFLILVYSDWCMPCKRLEPVWEKIVADMLPIGYGVGTVNNVHQGSFVRKLQVRHMPSVIAVVEERLHMYPGRDFSALAIIKFAKSVIPKHVIHWVNDNNYNYFLECYRKNKVPVLMFGSLEQPRLRFLLSAFKYQHLASFGYVQVGTNDREIRRKYQVNANYSIETLLVFNEHIESPVATVSRKGELTSDAINNAIEEHKFLILPRLSSQRHLNELCPSGDSKHICAVLLVAQPLVPLLMGDPEDVHVQAFRDYAEDKIAGSVSSRVRYAYMYYNTQRHIVGSVTPSIHLANSSYRDVFMFRRLDSRQLRYEFLKGGWSGEKHLVNECSEALKTQLNMYLKRSDLLKTPMEIQEFYDEHGPSLYRKIAYKTMRAYEHFKYHMKDEELMPLVSAVGVLALMVLLSYCFSYIVNQDAKNERFREYKRANQQANQSTTSSSSNNCAPNSLLHELRLETYNGLVTQLKPGCRSVVLICDRDTKETLCREFTKIVWPWRKNKTLSFGYLLVEKNLEWYKRILLETLDEPGRLATINPRNVIGTVVVVNGFRHYFQIYHAMHRSSNRRRTQKSNLRKRGGGNSFLGLDDPDIGRDCEDSLDEDSDYYEDDEYDYEKGVGTPLLSASSMKQHTPSILLTSELLSGLSKWLDRLFEGQVMKFYISEWPPMK